MILHPGRVIVRALLAAVATALLLTLVFGLLASQSAQADPLAPSAPAVASSVRLSWSSASGLLSLTEVNAGGDGQMTVSVRQVGGSDYLDISLPGGNYFAATSSLAGSNLSYNSGTPQTSNVASLLLSSSTVNKLTIDLGSGTGSSLTFSAVNQPSRLYVVDIKSGGALTLTQLQARDQISASVGTIATGNAGAVNVSAPTLQLYGTYGIGSAGNALGTQTAIAEMNAYTGSIYVANTGDLRIGISNTNGPGKTNLFPGIQVLATTGAYVVELGVTGVLSASIISDTIKAPGAITVTVSENIEAGCMIVGTNLPFIGSLNGPVRVTSANGDILLGNYRSNLRYYADITGKGVTLEAPNGSIIIDYVTYITSLGGPLNLKANNAIRVLKTGGYSGATFYTMGVTPITIEAPVFEMNSGGAIASSSAPMTITTDSAIISGTVRAPYYTLWLRPQTPGRTIDLGLGTTANALGLNAVEVANLDASGGTVRIGGPDAGVITVTAPITRAGTARLWLDSPLTITQVSGSLATAGRIANNNLRISSLNATLNQTNTAATTTIVDGLVKLNRANGPTLSGALVVGEGNGAPGSAQVQLQQSTQFLTTPVLTVYGDGLFQVNGQQQSVGALTGGVLAGGALSNTAGIDLSGGVLTTTHSTAATFTGLISGTGTLVKSGLGTLTLTNDNTFANLDVRQGKVVVNGTTPTTVSITDATLGGSGAVGDVVAISGTVAPGSSPGILTAASVAMDAGSILSMEINDPTSGTGYDQLRVTGGVTLTNPTLTIVSGIATVPNGQVFTLIDNQGAQPVDGIFAGLDEGATVTLGGMSLTVSYLGGDGNDVTLTAPGGMIYYPVHVPGDAAVSGGTLTQGTPFAVYATLTGLSGACFGPKLFYPDTGSSVAYTWNNSTWKLPEDTWATYAAIDGSSGSWSGWIIGAIPSSAVDTGNLAVGIHCSSNLYTADVAVTKMTMTDAGTGGWLDETRGINRAGRAVVVKDGTTIVGMYLAEDNGVDEGYTALAAAMAAPAATVYYKVGVLAGSGYTVESWNLASPGTPVDKVNTMGTEGCPSTAPAGVVTSMNACTSPTAVTLRTLDTRASVDPLGVVLSALGLVAAGGSVAWRRRRR
jgi:autotransporter-associated beta strand protein